MADAVFVCPTCKRRVRVKPAQLGRWVDCPRCGTGFAALAENEPEPDPVVGDVDAPAPARPSIALVLVVLGAVLAVAALVVIIVALNRPSQPSAPPPRPSDQLSDLSQLEDLLRQAQAASPANGSVAGGLLHWVGLLLVFSLVYLIALVALMAWVARDARNRGIDGAATWVLILLLTQGFGLLIYFASRPVGNLVVCGRCHRRCLEWAKACPHCGAKRRRKEALADG